MLENRSRENEKYFAAANTYHGFKSFFGNIFDYRKFDRIYVIKGGPGTGKSSMMKRIAAHLGDKCDKIEEIYCSSDPNSLDGIICENAMKKIAMIDGTSPHETDAKIPGAIDEIINLGENWDARWLSAKKEEIIELNEEKSTSYKTGYSYLKIAGEAAAFIMNVMEDNYDYNRSKMLIKEFCPNLSSNKENNNIRLISSFGKQGHFKLNTIEKIAGRTIEISGNEFSSMIFMNEVSNHLNFLGISRTEFPNALDPKYLDAIYIPSFDTAFVIGCEGIQADELIKKSIGYETERIKSAKGIRDIALTEAERWFGIASDLHFRLENIYTQAMCFEKNELILNKKLREIENILEL